MRSFILAASLATIIAAPAIAQTAPKAPAATAAPAATPAKAKAKFNSEDTLIGDLLDNPAAKAIVEKHIPGMTTNEQIDMARGMTLRAVQQYSPDDVTNDRLAAIDADLAKLPN